MRQAIEKAMVQCEGVREMFVMGDGDFSPFNLNVGSEHSWQDFRQKFPDTTFHFIALSESANEQMQTMAIIGHGSYTEIDCK